MNVSSQGSTEFSLKSICAANKLRWFVFIFASLLAAVTFAGPQNLNVNGRIIKSDGTALETSGISFVLQIKNPSGTCILFKETISSVDMSSSNGYFSLSLGSGTRNFPSSGTATLPSFFSNSATLTCQDGTAYTPVLTDTRLINIQFNDGSLWRAFSPDSVVRAVPYAWRAEASDKLDVYSATDFLLKTGIPSCTTGQYLSYDGANLSCSSVTGTTNGTVTAVSSANSDISVASGNSTPVLTLNSGTGASQILKLNTSSKIPAVDGSLLTNLDATHLVGITPIVNGGTGASTATAARANLGAAGSGNNTDIINLTAVNSISATGTIAASTLTGSTGNIGLLKVSTGTAAAPSIVNNGATTTGFYFTTNSFGFAASGTSIFTVDSTAGTTAAIGVTAPAFNYNSDRRLKTNIRTIEDPLNLVGQLRGVRFDWKSNQSPDVGFIAQEVESVVPELVKTAPGPAGPDTKSVKYGNIVAIAVEAIKSLWTQVIEMESRVSNLETQNSQLQKENADLRLQLQQQSKLIDERLSRLENQDSK